MTASHVGTRWRWSHAMTGRLTTAMKSALRKGSRISLASRSPATTTIVLAATTRKRIARRGISSSRPIDVCSSPGPPTTQAPAARTR